ncbi:MAG: PAS domain S-box protein [Phenylobacterium sp.]|uniref:PAS domain S-box protein n=1 Tax=Phenylobacterium sp. TaxID=1871053 RepID=UPI001A416035|nr:PAS domain S-box protein [Phenylobacterium sp.]MBL8771959.1 PAS domain S-box protein [Phenylobacterium sp.]
MGADETAAEALAFIAEHTSDLIARFGVDGRIRYVSPAVRRYGYAPEALVGQPIAALTHPEDLQGLMAHILRLAQDETDGPARRETRFRTADGTWLWFEGNPRPVRNGAGEVEVVTVLRDITDRRALEDAAREQAELFEAAFRSAGSGIAIVTPTGVIRRANRVFCRIVGYDETEVVGLAAGRLIHADDIPGVRARAEALLRGEIESSASEERYLRKDGSTVWVHTTASAVRDAQGLPQYFVCQVHDQTARRAAEDALRESEARLREQMDLVESAFRYAVVGKALVGPDGRFLRLNDAFCRMVGYSEVELLELDFQTITHPDDLTADIHLVKRVIAGDIDSYRIDKRYICKNGESVWARLGVSLVRDAEGRPKYFISQVEDLTAQKAAEAALRESEARYRLIADNMSDVVVQLDAEARITYVSPSVRAYGYEPGDLLGLQTDHLVHPDDLDPTPAGGERAGEPADGIYQARFRARNGEWIWMESNAHALRNEHGELVGEINVLRNVGERRAQAELFETAFQQAATGKCLVELDNRIAKVNSTLCRMLGYTEAEFITLNGDDLIHPDERGRGNGEIARLRAGEIDSYTRERRFLKADGTYLWCEITMSMVRNPDGSPKHYVTELRDLTEQRAAQAALRASEARYRMISENTSDLIVMSDLSGKAIYVSPNVRMSGRLPRDIEGRSFAESMHPDDAGVVFEAFRKLALEGGATRVRWRARRGDGWQWMESNPSLMRDPETGEPTGFLDVIRDIDRQVAQEAEIERAKAAAEAAAAAKSQFLANMSHEIRTPLTAVLGFTNLLTELDLPGPAAGYANRIAGAGNALLAIVNDILDFSKLEAGKFEIRPKAIEVAAVCEETLQLFSTQADGKGLSLRFEADPEAARVAMLDGDRLRQMLINLIGNAIKFTEAGEVALVLAAGGEPDWLRIEVADTGPGLDAESQGVLFQRFTQIDGSMTRRHGGTGLGLAISRGIADAMGGRIGVVSELGSGATFFVELPAPAAELPSQLAHEDGRPVQIEGIRVFVVDDNAANRELSRRILEAAGAEVDEAADGAEALERLGLLPVDVVLMDLRMPGLDGREALRRLRRASGPNQHVPVLAFTADADLEGEGDLAGFDGLVRKPIQPLDMYTAILSATTWAPEEEDADVAG